MMAAAINTFRRAKMLFGKHYQQPEKGSFGLLAARNKCILHNVVWQRRCAREALFGQASESFHGAQSFASLPLNPHVALHSLRKSYKIQ